MRALGLVAAVGLGACSVAPIPPPAAPPRFVVDRAPLDLVDRLGADDPFEREDAQRRLEEMGERAREALRTSVLCGEAEVRLRASTLLRALDLRPALRGVRLAYGHNDGLYVVDLPDGRPRHVLDGSVTSVAWMPEAESPCGAFLVVETATGRLHVVDVAAGTSRAMDRTTPLRARECELAPPCADAELAVLDPRHVLDGGFLVVWRIARAGAWHESCGSPGTLTWREEFLALAVYDPSTHRICDVLPGVELESLRLGRSPGAPRFAWALYIPKRR